MLQSAYACRPCLHAAILPLYEGTALTVYSTRYARELQCNLSRDPNACWLRSRTLRGLCGRNRLNISEALPSGFLNSGQ